MPLVDDAIALVGKAATDMGVTKLAAHAGVTDDFIRRLTAGDVKVVEKLRRLETVAQAHADAQREMWSEAGAA